MSALFSTAVAAAISSNLALDALLGICPLLALSRKHEVASGMAAATLIALPVFCGAGYALQTWLLRPLAAEALSLLLWVLLLSLSTGVLERWLRLAHPTLHANFGVFLPLLGVNCLVLGAVLLATTRVSSLPEVFAYSLGTAGGYGAVLLIVGSLRERLSMTPLPAPMRGAAAVLVTLGLLSLALMGLQGMA
ncbi:MAG: Rnf-Nqr domain containing protein [Chromatiales bacterium]